MTDQRVEYPVYRGDLVREEVAFLDMREIYDPSLEDPLFQVLSRLGIRNRTLSLTIAKVYYLPAEALLGLVLAHPIAFTALMLPLPNIAYGAVLISAALNVTGEAFSNSSYSRRWRQELGILRHLKESLVKTTASKLAVIMLGMSAGGSDGGPLYAVVLFLGMYPILIISRTLLLMLQGTNLFRTGNLSTLKIAVHTMFEFCAGGVIPPAISFIALKRFNRPVPYPITLAGFLIFGAMNVLGHATDLPESRLIRSVSYGYEIAITIIYPLYVLTNGQIPLGMWIAILMTAFVLGFKQWQYEAVPAMFIDARNVREPANYGIGRAVQRLGSVHTSRESMVRHLQDLSAADPPGLRRRHRDDREAGERATPGPSQ